MRRLAQDRLAFAAPTMGSRHAGGHTGFINEDQRAKVEPRLRCSPDLARYRNAETVLLAGIEGSFLKRRPSFLTVRQTLA
jgi:hypothetical protein